MGLDVADSGAAHEDPFRAQQGPFERFVPTIPAQAPCGGNHAVTRDVWRRAPAHDRSYGARRARAPRNDGDVAVGGHTAGRNSPDGGQDASFERCHRLIFRLKAEATRNGDKAEAMGRFGALRMQSEARRLP